MLLAVWAAHCIIQFLQGRYLTGKSSTRETRERWDEYGEGAYSGDSPVYLFFATALIAALLYAVLAALGKLQSHGSRLAPVALVVIGLGSVASIALIASSALNGVPFRNFEPMGADGLLYSLSALVPAVGLFGVIAVTVRVIRPLGTTGR